MVGKTSSEAIMGGLSIWHWLFVLVFVLLVIALIRKGILPEDIGAEWKRLTDKKARNGLTPKEETRLKKITAELAARAASETFKRQQLQQQQQQQSHRPHRRK
ncbi:hypothetical protein WI40_14770 [Burkholderia ubonensis]|nr:hypothetical protein WI40_14770 [Burkholderia ubonensis]